MTPRASLHTVLMTLPALLLTPPRSNVRTSKCLLRRSRSAWMNADIVGCTNSILVRLSSSFSDNMSSGLLGQSQGHYLTASGRRTSVDNVISFLTTIRATRGENEQDSPRIPGLRRSHPDSSRDHLPHRRSARYHRYGRDHDHHCQRHSRSGLQDRRDGVCT